MSSRTRHRLGLALGLAAAATFGAGTPFAKRLLEDARPQLLAGLLYLGAFLVLATTIPARRHAIEARLRRSDLPRLIGVVLCGGILAPVLLLVGLERVSGVTGSLLLNLEGPFTLLLALAIFAEHLDRRAALGAAVVFGGGALLALGDGGGSIDVLGVLCIAAACLLWAIDNNLTQSLTVRDPFSIAFVKAGAAAAVNLALALVLGAALPSIAVLVAALGLGAVSYGVSIVFDTYALRLLGAAREAVIFAAAPFVGAALAIPVLSETLTTRDLAAALMMAAGLALILNERHDHRHVHRPVVHEHAHVHDAHHQHEHTSDTSPTDPHTHVHRHGRVEHAHAHVSDAHHRHPH
jgi:drug/metabolite transporter (DMT)-like permease